MIFFYRRPYMINNILISNINSVILTIRINNFITLYTISIIDNISAQFYVHYRFYKVNNLSVSMGTDNTIDGDLDFLILKHQYCCDRRYWCSRMKKFHYQYSTSINQSILINSIISTYWWISLLIDESVYWLIDSIIKTCNVSITAITL